MIHQEFHSKAYFWVLQGLCALHRKPYSDKLARQQCAAPYTGSALVKVLDLYGLNAEVRKCKSVRLHKEVFPLLAWLRMVRSDQDSDTFTNGSAQLSPALILQADGNNVLIVESSDTAPRTVSLAEFEQRYTGQIARITPIADLGLDADSALQQQQARRFGFSWFVPELVKHKKLWQEILLASLVIQLIALATPLFTQAIIDKVVVHRTQSTLVVIAIGMLVFMIFSAGLSWLRQYLVLHTGNRVDAVLGSAVFERLFKLPPLYFQHRSTGTSPLACMG